MDISKMEYELIIKAKGVGYYVEFLIYVIIIILSLVMLLLDCQPQNYLKFGVIGIIIPLVTIILCIIGFYKITKKSKVIFTNKKILTLGGQDFKEFNPLNIDCDKIIEYKFTHKNFLPTIQFILLSGTKKYFMCTQFSKKQILQILLEIQKRGGLLDIEVNLDDYYIRKKKSKDKNN